MIFKNIIYIFLYITIMDNTNIQFYTDTRAVYSTLDEDSKIAIGSASGTVEGFELLYDNLTTPKEFKISKLGINFDDGVVNNTTSLSRIAEVQTLLQAVETPPNATTFQIDNTLLLTDGTNNTSFDVNGVDLDITTSGTGHVNFNRLPECSVVPTTNNQLVNKSYVDGSPAPTANISSTNLNASYFPVFVSASGTGQVLRCDDATGPFQFNPNTGAISLANTINISGSGAVATIRLGIAAGATNQGNFASAIGFNAGTQSQGQNGVAIGQNAGRTNQGIGAVSIGNGAGQTTQSNNAIAIGPVAGNSTQGNQSIAIGINAGNTTQGNFSVAIGSSAGNTTQGTNAVAIGLNAGQTTQNSNAVAIGDAAGNGSQGANAVAVGINAGNSNQGSHCVAIGNSAGRSGQGNNSVAIGRLAGDTNQDANSICINASGAPVNPNQAGLFINPVRAGALGSSFTPALPANVLYYNNATSEILRTI